MCVNISAPHPLFFPSLFLYYFFFVSCVANTLCVLPALPPGNTVRPVKNRGALQRRRDYLLSISADDLPEDVLESGGGLRRWQVAVVVRGGDVPAWRMLKRVTFTLPVANKGSRPPTRLAPSCLRRRIQSGNRAGSLFSEMC